MTVLKRDYGVKSQKGARGQVLAEKLVEGLSVTRACRYMGISRQAHYKGLACQRTRPVRL